MRYLNESDEFETNEEEDHNESSSSPSDKPWGHVFAASLIVQTVTLTGVFVSFLVGAYSQRRMARGRSSIWALAHDIIIPSFAAGALLATAVFLLVPEALELIGGGHDAHAGEEDAHDEDEFGNATRSFRVRGLEEEGEESGGAELAGHNETSWKFGASLLSGFLLPAILHALFSVHLPRDDNDYDHETNKEKEDLNTLEKTEASFPSTTMHQETMKEDHDDEANRDEEEQSEEEQSEEEEEDPKKTLNQKISMAKDTNKAVLPPQEQVAATSAAPPNKPKNWSLAMSILAGDFFHNFTDGIFIGTSFMLCGNEIGYTVTATTVYHELAQEIADFSLLVHHCHMKTWEALLFNFMSGFSVFLGAIAVLSSDIDDLTQGVILAISAGVYFYLAGVECVPRVQRALKTIRDYLAFFACFIIGAVPIGLVLLSHGHCEVQQGDHEDEQHQEGESAEEHAEHDRY
ncbi:hypothetical protein ACA910_022666 [Epithemia clementina (nom. ined.)]